MIHTEKFNTEDNERGFIQQTANDYDLAYSQVERIYIRYGKSYRLFYEKLEDELRAPKD